MPAHFGLDISPSSIKVVEARNTKEGYELIAFGEVKTPASLQSNSSQDEEMISRALKQLVSDAKIRSRDVYIALPEAQVYTRVIELPVLGEKELENAVKFESEQYIPVPLNEVYLEYQVLQVPPQGITQSKMQVLLVAAKKNIVEKLMKIAQISGLTPLVIETALLAGMRVLKPQLNDYSLLVEIGDSSTDIAILQGGILKQSSSLPTAGQALTRSISQNLSLSEQQAKQYKHVYGLEKDQLEGKIALSMSQPMTQIVNHIIKNIRFAKSLTRDGKIEQIVLSGGTALLPGLTTFLVEQINVEVNLANPFQNCLNQNLPRQLIAAGPRFASVIGLAIRE